MTCRLAQQALHLRRRPVEVARQLRADLQVRTLAPAELGELHHGTDERFRGGAGVLAGGRLGQQLETAFAENRDVPFEDRLEHRLPAPEVVMDRRRVALPRGTHDLRERHVVDPPLGEEPLGRVEQLLPSVHRLRFHLRSTVPGTRA